jgi:hypothetical protein
MDALPAVTANASLAHFTAGDYRPSAFYFRHLDMGCLLALSLLLTWWDSPAGEPAALGKLAVTVGVLLALAALVAARRPYRPHEAWKGPVRVYSLLLSCVSAALNAAHYIDQLGQAASAAAAPSQAASDGSGVSGDSADGGGTDGSGDGTGSSGPSTGSGASLASVEPSQAVLVLSYATFAGSIGLLLTLLAAFFATLLRGARREKAVDEAAARARVQRAAERKALNPLLVAGRLGAAAGAGGGSPGAGAGAGAGGDAVAAVANPLAGGVSRRAVVRMRGSFTGAPMGDAGGSGLVTNPLAAARPGEGGSVGDSKAGPAGRSPYAPGGGGIAATSAALRLAGYASRRAGGAALSPLRGASAVGTATDDPEDGEDGGADDDGVLREPRARLAPTASRRAVRASMAPVAFGVAQVAGGGGGGGQRAPGAAPSSRGLVPGGGGATAPGARLAAPPGVVTPLSSPATAASSPVRHRPSFSQSPSPARPGLATAGLYSAGPGAGAAAMATASPRSATGGRGGTPAGRAPASGATSPGLAFYMQAPGAAHLRGTGGGRVRRGAADATRPSDR